MIEQTLKQLDFSDKEIAIYLTILKHGKTSPVTIARETNINRTTVYSVAKELLQKGVIVEDLADKAMLLALPPVELGKLITRQEKALSEKKSLVNQAIDELAVYTKNIQYSVPKIKFIYEEELNEYLYKQAPPWNESILMRDSIWWGFQDPSFVEHYQEWIDWYWQECVPKEISLRLLTSKSDVEKTMKRKQYERRMMKFWNKSDSFSATTWVIGDYLLMIVTNQRPHYLVEIHDVVLAHNMRTIFQGLWEEV